MKVLFVASGNIHNGISIITKNQALSIQEKGIDIDFFLINRRGFRGYVASIRKLRRKFKETPYDIYHAHYSLSGVVAALARAKPLVVSLMGSDVMARYWFKWIIYLFHRFFWTQTITKSESLSNILGIADVLVIPNGVNFNLFLPMDKEECQARLKWDRRKIHILFPSNPNRPEKNYALFSGALELLRKENIEPHVLVDIKHNDVPVFLNAADIIVLTSLWEGSPNVIKEAMACNRPIVCTDVGDVRNNFIGIDGCFICSYKPKDVVEKINLGLQYGQTNAREKITHLSSDSIAKQLIKIYQSVIGK